MSASIPGEDAAASSPEEELDSKGYQLSAVDLLFLAAGGAIGSGWLLTGRQVDTEAGTWGVVSWLVGGILMLVIAAVMVELSSQQPKTGGLIWLPNESSGPLLTLVLAAGLWAFYTVNPASESTAMVRGLEQSGVRGLVAESTTTLTQHGKWVAAGFVAAIYLVNLFGFRFFVRVTNVLTAIKIAVPVLLIVLLVVALIVHPTPLPHPAVGADPPGPQDRLSVLTTVAGGGVIYAYLGFQGPLDFAGNVRTDAIGEARRLRRAVIGTVVGSMLLYIALQAVVIWSRNYDDGQDALAPFGLLIHAVLHGPAASAAMWVLNVDTVLAPAGSALVFTQVLTWEVAALSRASLTHEGLSMRVFSFMPGRRLARLLGGSRVDVHWLILLVNGTISTVALTAAGGNWIILGSLTAILALIVYASPSVVLVALDRSGQGYVTLGWRRRILARLAFVSIGVIFFLTDWDVLWKGLVALFSTCVVLFGLPALSARRRWYAAHSHGARLLRWRSDPSAEAAVTWLGYFTLLTIGTLPFYPKLYAPAPGVDISGHLKEFLIEMRFAALLLVVAISVLVFERLVVLSARHMAKVPPSSMPRSPRAPRRISNP